MSSVQDMLTLRYYETEKLSFVYVYVYMCVCV